MGKFFKRLIVASILIGAFYFSFGFFVIEPIGVLKDGSTVLYCRLGLDSQFISSAEGILQSHDEDVTTVGKLVVLGRYGKKVNDRKIASFPYSSLMHHYSTTGQVFE